jgi:hypothetical protein
MTKAVVMAAMSDPNAKALDIIQRQPDLDENLRAKYLLGAVKFESPPIAPVPPPQPGDSAKLIDVHRSADDVALVAQADRQSLLQTRSWLVEFEGDPLTAEERVELAALDAKGDLEAALPAHLRPVVDPVDIELRALLMEDEPMVKPDVPYEPPSETRSRLDAKQAPVAEVVATTLAEPPEDGEVPMPADDDDDGLD